MEISLIDEVNRFVSRIESMRIMLPIMIKVISDTNEKSKEEFDEYLSKNKIKKVEKDGRQLYLASLDKITGLKKLQNEIKSAELARTYVPSSFLITLISQYDAYLGRLIEFMFEIKPELLLRLEKQLTYSQLSKFDSMLDVRQHIIEKEIESVLRESHSKQIDWLEDKIDTTLKGNTTLWQHFIELTERRNLLVHTDGAVSQQYLSVCKDNKVPLPDNIKFVTRLNVSRSYFDNACDCILEMGVKLSQVIWRKLAPKDIQHADKALYDICHRLIIAGNYLLAAAILEFPTTTPAFKCLNDRNALRFKIDRAQALKWAGEESKCREVLSSEDWSAKAIEFRLARAVLEENYTEALQHMTDIGQKGAVKSADYRTEPLYKEFIKTECFRNKYKEIFKEEMSVSELDAVMFELSARPDSIAYDSPELDRLRYDIDQCLDEGIRKCCIGDKGFPPIEIHKVTTVPENLKYLVVIEPSKEHELRFHLTVVLQAEILSLRDNKILISCAGSLSEDGTHEENPPYPISVFEGVLDAGIIWNELDRNLSQIYEMSKKMTLSDLRKGARGPGSPFWLTL